MKEEKLRLNLNDIYSKWGFEDGDILIDFLDELPELEIRCRQLFNLIKYLVGDREKVELIISCHNPVRASVVFGKSKEDIEEKELGFVELTKSEILKIINNAS